MKRYVIANAATGEIDRIVACDSAQAASQAQSDELMLESNEAALGAHYVKDGAVVAYTEVQREAKAARPTHPAEWSNTAMAWVDLRDLDAVKADKWAEIKAERDSRESGGFPYMGRMLDSDMLSVMRMKVAESSAMAAKSAGVTGVIEQWRCADNSLLPMTADEVLGMLLALGAWGGNLHAIANALREQIFHPAAAAADIEAISWPT